MAESKGAAQFYALVYDADRPELFSRRRRTASSIRSETSAFAGMRRGTFPSLS